MVLGINWNSSVPLTLNPVDIKRIQKEQIEILKDLREQRTNIVRIFED